MPSNAAAVAPVESLGRHVPKTVGTVIAVLVLGGLALVAPSFFTRANLINLLRQVSITGILACGMTVVMVAGGFDLSVGAVAALAGVLAVVFATRSIGLAILVPLLAGGVAGGANGLLVTRWSVNPLIATLGMRYVIYAIANIVTGGFIQIAGPALSVLGSSVGRVPVPAAIFLGLAALIHVCLRWSAWEQECMRLVRTSARPDSAAFRRR